MPAGARIRHSLVVSRGAKCTTAGSGFPRHPGGVLTISSQDLVDSGCDAGGGEETDPSSSVGGKRVGGAVARASIEVLIAANSSQLVQSFASASRSEWPFAFMTVLHSALLEDLRFFNWEIQNLADAQ